MQLTSVLTLFVLAASPATLAAPTFMGTNPKGRTPTLMGQQVSNGHGMHKSLVNPANASILDIDTASERALQDAICIRQFRNCGGGPKRQT